MTIHRLAASALILLACALAAQETQPLRLAKLRQQLEQRPGHAAVFEAYFKALVAANAVEAEIALLEGRLQQDAGETTLSLILGRLLLRANQEDKALLVLDGIAAKTPELFAVYGTKRRDRSGTSAITAPRFSSHAEIVPVPRIV